MLDDKDVSFPKENQKIYQMKYCVINKKDEENTKKIFGIMLHKNIKRDKHYYKTSPPMSPIIIKLLHQWAPLL